MSKQNIILIVLDAVRADHLSCYGYERETSPEIDRLAQNGIKYNSAFSNANWTGVAHPPIFTGLLPSNSGIHGENLSFPDDLTLLSEILKNAGYRTFGTSAGAHISADRGYNRGFDDFRETHRFRPKIQTLRELINDPEYRKQLQFSLTRGPDEKTLYKFEALKRFIQSGSGPIFGFFNCKTAHYPYNPPRPYKTKFCPDLERPRYEFLELLNKKLGREGQHISGVDIHKCRTNPVKFMTDDFEVSKKEWDIIKSWYDGSIRYLDYRIGELVKTLERQGILSETYLIITADHGEMFGERGLTAHYFSLYDSLLNVPLIIRPPSGTDGSEIPECVSLIDLFNTILDMADLPLRERDHSKSLLDIDQGDHHNYIFAEEESGAGWIKEEYPDFNPPEGSVEGIQSVRNDEFKLIWNRDGHVELYRWREDPTEQNDVSDEYPKKTESMTDVLKSNTSRMNAREKDQGDRQEELKETLEHLGYR